MPITIWSLKDAKRKHRHSLPLAKALCGMLPPDDAVLDLGCGDGFYLGYLANRGYKCLGVEGTRGISEIAQFTNIVEADLSKPLSIRWPRSTLLSFEVGEHLLPTQEDQFVSTIDRYCKRWLIISWAIPGQKGHGHNNCRSNDYVLGRFNSCGFEYLEEHTSALREVIEQHTEYFKKTLLVLRRS